MRPIQWKKQGRIVSPDDAPPWRCGHSGMVTVLPWQDGQVAYRMFLTGRGEGTGFHLGWLDLDASFNVVNEPDVNPILPPGEMGCFDCQGMCMPAVVRVSESTLYMYYVGWGLSLPGMFTNRCGLAISNDNGNTWQRWSRGPLAMIDDRDPIGIGTVHVIREAPDNWHMWYTTFRDWQERQDGSWRHFYYIKYARSADGITWEKPADNIAIDFIDDKEYAVGRPMVIKEPDGYRMWFCMRSDGSTYRIGYAESDDGLTWTRAPSGVEPSESGWDADMVEYSYVIKRDDDYLMFYNGNGFGASGTGLAVGRLK